MYFSLGRCCLEFTQALSSVALAWHKAGGSTPLGVTREDATHASELKARVTSCIQAIAQDGFPINAVVDKKQEYARKLVVDARPWRGF